MKTFKEIFEANKVEKLDEAKDIDTLITKMINEAQKAVEIAIAMFYDDIEKDTNKGINKVLDYVYKAYKKNGMEPNDAKPLVKIAFAKSLKENNIDVPESFVKGILKDLGK